MSAPAEVDNDAATPAATTQLQQKTMGEGEPPSLVEFRGFADGRESIILGERTPLVHQNRHADDGDHVGVLTIFAEHKTSGWHLVAAVCFTAFFLKSTEMLKTWANEGELGSVQYHSFDLMRTALKVVVFVPPAIYILWFLVQRYRRGERPAYPPKPSTPPSKASTRVLARFWTVVYLAAWAVYYILYLADTKHEYPSPDMAKARAVVWNFAICVAVCCTAHLSVDFANVAPLGLMVLLVPFATPDRYPWAPFGCPNYVHHIVGAYGVICALAVWKCRDLEVYVVGERHRGASVEMVPKKNGTPKPSILYFEAISLWCAFFSFGYLSAIGVMIFNRTYDRSHHLEKSAESFYHICFAYLRPAYTFAFAVYYLKRIRSNYTWELLQGMIAGFAVIYFILLCPLAVTGFTKKGATCAHPRVEKLPSKNSNLYEVNNELYEMETPLSFAAHCMESTSFYFNMVFFAIHGLCSGSWEDDPPKALSFLNITASANLIAFTLLGVIIPILTFLTLLTDAKGVSDKAFFPDYDHAANYMTWATLHYLFGYACAFFPSAYILARRARTLVVFYPISPHHAGA